MIFDKTTAHRIRQGTKTQHREPQRHDHDGHLLPPKLRPGRDYAIQRAGSTDTTQRIHILTARQADLSALTYHDARAEGHRTTTALKDAWMLRHDQHWPPTHACEDCDGEGTLDCPACWNETPAGPVRAHPLDHHPCPHCTDGQAPLPIDDDLVNEWFTAHENTRVWVIEFELQVDPVLFMAHPIPGVSGDTTPNIDRAIDDLEVVDPDTLRPRWQENARRRHAHADRSSTAARLTRRLAS